MKTKKIKFRVERRNGNIETVTKTFFVPCKKCKIFICNCKNQ